LHDQYRTKLWGYSEFSLRRSCLRAVWQLRAIVRLQESVSALPPDI
jgi:hypothetical protein